jgi:hypothetical protein
MGQALPLYVLSKTWKGHNNLLQQQWNYPKFTSIIGAWLKEASQSDSKTHSVVSIFLYIG